MQRFQVNEYVTLGQTEDEGGEILIYGNIGDDDDTCLGANDEVTPQKIRDSLKMFQNVKYLDLRICSNGGSTIAGNAIIEIIDSFKKSTGIPVYAHIEGIAASMGSGIAMAADKIYMAENALMMLHKPYTVAFGNEKDLQKRVEVLQKSEETIVSNYMRHFSGTEEELRNMLAEETWLTAKEALACGLCDEITEPIRIVASADGIQIQNISFPHKDIPSKFYNLATKPIEANANANTSISANSSNARHALSYVSPISGGNYSTKDYHSPNMRFEKYVPPVDVSGETIRQPNFSDYLHIDTVKDFFGKKVEFTDLLEFAKNGMNVDPDTNKKAKAYDTIVNKEIEKAIENGIRANGTSFDENRWRKILSLLEYDDIIGQSEEWATQAKKALNAGKRISRPQDRMILNGSYKKIKPEDYDFIN